MSASRSILARTAVIAAVALIVAVIVGPMLTGWRATGQMVAAPTASDTAGSVKGITVVGTGKVTLKPDLATIVVGVQAQATTAAKAQSQASAATAKIIAAVKGQGVADADITSQWISLQPQYDYSANGAAPPRVTGYLANQSLAVKVRQIDKAGPVIDAAVGAGANQVGGISFSVADPTGATAQARTAAMADAKQRAQSLAQGAGISLGAVVAVSEVASPSPTPIPYAAAVPAAGDISKTPVQVGTTEVEVDVQVTFAIGS